MRKSVRIAVSIPDEDFKKLERLRKEKGMSRSKLFVEAFRLMQDSFDTQKNIRKYQEGYRKFPECSEEVEAWTKASLSAFSGDEW